MAIHVHRPKDAPPRHQRMPRWEPTHLIDGLINDAAVLLRRQSAQLV
jgi:hypothetical protein